MSRELDVLVYGATGFTGGLVARHLAERLGPNGRWGLAGRRADKLEAVRAGLGQQFADVPVVVADAADAASMQAMTARTVVLLDLVGPYARTGDAAVLACLATDTHRCDLTGEPRWWLSVIERFHAQAESRGLRFVSACGFDSVPHDLGALLVARELPADGTGSGLQVLNYVLGNGSFSGGTWASALGAMAGDGAGRSAASGGSTQRGPPRPGLHRAPSGRWAVPLPLIDPLVVKRSAQLDPATYADPAGGGFTFGHYMELRTPQLLGLAAGAPLVALGARVPAIRAWLESLRPSGSGPDEATRARSFFRCHLVGRRGERGAVVEVSGGDPGYTETSRMIAETALALAVDPLPARHGVLTTATACGDALLARLRQVGLRFEVTAPAAG